MSDTSLNQVIQYGTQAERIALTPNPAVGSQVLYLWYETDNEPDTYAWNGATWEQINLAAAGGITQLTGDVTAGPGSGSQAATIANDAVTNAKAANMVESTIKGRAVGAGTGDPTDLTSTTATAILNNVVGDSGAGGTKGLVPAAAAGDAALFKYLSAAGVYTNPASYLQYREEQAQNTAGGTFTAGAWQTRVLNTEVSDAGGFGVLSTNQITLSAGTYRIYAEAPAMMVARNQLRLQNITDTTTVLIGQSSYADTANLVFVVAQLRGIFTIAASKALELQHQCQTTKATDGLGVPANFTTEVYAVVELWKIG